MRRTLIGFLGGLTLLAGVVLVPSVADAGKQPAGCSSSSSGVRIATGDDAQDLGGYKATVKDPAQPATLLEPAKPAVYDGGAFSFGLGLAGPSCTNALYTVFVFKQDDLTNADGTTNPTATGEGQYFQVPGDGSSSTVDITRGEQAIFAGYNGQCVIAHATITLNGALLSTSREHKLCGPGGGGRIWG